MVKQRAPLGVDAQRQIRAMWFALYCSLAIALAVVLTAISIQSGRTVDKEGHGWPFSLLFGPGIGPNLQGWRVVTEPGQLLDADRYRELLVAFTIVDFAYVAVYVLLLRAVIRTLARGRWRSWTIGVLYGLVAVDVVENVLSLLIWSGVSTRAIVTTTVVKWGLLAVIAGLLLLSTVTVPRTEEREGPDERALGTRLKRTYKAVTHQRFAFVPMVALFVLSVLSGTAILEQLPDVLRRWTSDPNGLRHAVLAMASTLVVSIALVIAGQFRGDYAEEHSVRAGRRRVRDDPKRPPYLVVWLVGPLLATLGVFATLIFGDVDELLPWRFAIFALVPLVLIVLVSLILRRVWADASDDTYRFDRPLVFDDREVTAVRVAGNIAGLGVAVVGGLSLLRAFVPLVIVRQSETGADPTQVWAYVAIGAGSVVVPWLIAILALHLGSNRRGSESFRRLLHLGRPGSDRPVGSWALLVSGLIAFALPGLLPSIPSAIGVAATATLALGGMALMLSAVALMLQDRPTAEVFRAVGLTRSPLVSMLVLTLVLVTLLGGQSSIHEIDRGRPVFSTVDTRDTIDDAFDTWLDEPDPCTVTVAGRQVRPMLLVAAEGGGIRAAYWTVRGLQAIADSTCAENATLFSAGASGGSVGLTVARFSGTRDAPDPAAAVDAVKQMADPAILARATDGTFVRDLVYGANGVPVPRLGEPEPFTWRDRARLIEDGWADTAGAGGQDWGDRDFLTPHEELSPTTGQLILNSSDVKHSCRVWVSQIRPGRTVTDRGEPGFDPERSCDKFPGPAARTLDLFSTYGPFVPGAAAGSCLGQIRSATAALLTARFPYVTPSAVVGPCPQEQESRGKAKPYWPRTQLVDGGYLENSGLATVTDLSDDWIRLVRDHNDTVLASPGSTRPLVVPIVVFLTNGDRGVIQPAINSSPVSELVVPLLTYFRGAAALSGNDALLERARAAVEVPGFCPRSAPACTAIAEHFPARVVVIDRITQPEIGAPLGWVMSQASINSMDYSMINGQLQTRCAANAPRQGGAYAPVRTDRETLPSCRRGYATLGDLVRYYSTPPS